MTKRAIIKMAVEAAAEFLSLLQDAGLELVATLESDWVSRTVLFVVEGDRLPEECEPDGKPLKAVKVVATTEAYGKQRINRISSIEIDQHYHPLPPYAKSAPYDSDAPSTWERYSETKDDGGKIVLVRYPEGYRLRCNGETVWKEGETVPPCIIHVEGKLDKSGIDGLKEYIRRVTNDAINRGHRDPWGRA